MFPITPLPKFTKHPAGWVFVALFNTALFVGIAVFSIASNIYYALEDALNSKDLRG